jgi:DNA-directed RNA polymerase specialized sigma24 family protein
VSATDRFRGEDWGKLQAKLTAFAYGRTGKRSLEHAQDLAQTAIADAISRPETWDPEKEPLLKHLAKRVIGLASNDRARKRNQLEVLFTPSEDEEPPDAELEADALEDILDRRRAAARFRAGIDGLVAGDEDAVAVVAEMSEGRDTPAAIAKASQIPIVRVRAARRRVFYHADALVEQMGEELDGVDDLRRSGSKSTDRTEEEVDQ